MRKKKYSSPTVFISIPFSEDAYEHMMCICSESGYSFRDVVVAATLQTYGIGEIMPDADWNPLLNDA